MTLVDTSVWVDHLRRRNERLAVLLDDAQVLGHPFVVGELACGNLKNRRAILELLAALPAVSQAEHAEVLHLVESHLLNGRGLGWVDAHLLASCLINGCELWTFDKPLRAAAIGLGIAF